MKPNILLCTCDQLRAFELGCYGNPIIRTPNLDRLATEGVRFETAVTNYPVCMAARSVLLSGQYNRTCTGGVGNVAYASRPGEFNMPEYPEHGRPHLKDRTLPEVLRDQGYHTAVIGKWHIHSWPHEIGFEDYLIPRVHHCHTGQNFTENGGPEFVADGYSVDFEADRVASFLESRRGSDRPFFLYYNISPPHCPTADAPERYRTLYRPEDVPIRPNADPDKPLPDQDYWFKVYRWDFRYYSLHLPHTEELPPGYSLRHLIAEYYGLTTWMDDTVGKMLAALDAAGLSDNTIVVFTADHGDNLGSHGWVQKGGPNEESARIPMVLRGPFLGGSRVVRRQAASLVDVMPTLLDLIGIPVPDHVHGQSLAPVVRGKAENLARDFAVIEMAQGAAMRSPTHLYSLPWDTGRVLSETPEFFFDMRDDPYQLRNLAGSKEQSDAARSLDRELRAWDARTPWRSL